MPDKLYASPVLRQQPEDPWAMEHVPCERQPAKTGDAKRVRRDKGTRQVVVTLRDDQFGQLVCFPSRSYMREYRLYEPILTLRYRYAD